ncbi:xanthine dehydrogenase family protein molybdopterin-binding subunit [Microscilla marina]|uniref:Aldehyde oxidase n=1 Tax=Microscilla marina ATCC 23134 TaxID=313606 RepID=A1ZSQ5_MICM2|nr:molybdopterin cofactor-binding domain-containing protein [Microscilla marina]EAY26635.1 aldehyde oxidase [Microscilla marina ATCC 23134]
MNRRTFVKVSTAVSGGLLLSLALPVGNVLAKDLPTFTPNAFLEIDTQGLLTFTLTKLEMGQGSGTGLPQILADELGADWQQIKIVRATYDKRFSRNEQGTTGGSSSIRKLWHPLRKAGATARMLLVEAAIQYWQRKHKGVFNQQNCYTQNGQVIHRPSGKKLAFGKIAGAAAKLPIPEKITFKKTSAYQYIGKSVTNLITPGVVKGQDEYGINTKIPGMLYAAAVRCPVYKGTLKSYDAKAALGIKGVQQVIKVTNVDLKNDPYVFDSVVVIARSTWAAFKGKQALKVQWNEGKNGQRSLKSVRKEILEAGKLPITKPTVNLGDTTAAFKDAEVIEATYENPFQAHALLEPMNAVAKIEGNQCEVWASTQSAQNATQAVAKVTGLKEENITIHVLPGGGSFGRRGEDHIVEAVLVSKAIGGKPVKMVWTPEDGMQHDQYHPYHYSNYRAAIKNNQLVGWENKIVRASGSQGGNRLYDIFYHFGNAKNQCTLVDPPIPIGAWRSVSVHSATLGMECFMDEIAHKLKQDAYKLRMELLNHPVELVGTGDRAKLIQNFRKLTRKRFRQVLPKVVEVGQWGKKMPKGHGQGLAVAGFSRTACAQIAEVSVNQGKLKVHKITCVMHLGKVINPHFVRGQVEGSIIWSLGALLYGGVDFENGRVKQSNYHDYKVLRMDETPEIVVHLIESEDDPTGAGEPAVPPLAPAVLNAIFAATGKRIRKIPVLPKDLV